MDITWLAVWICLPLFAAYLAHRKQRSWIGALVVTAIAPPLGLLAVLLTGPERSAGGKGAGLKARVVFGLLPFDRSDAHAAGRRDQQVRRLLERGSLAACDRGPGQHRDTVAGRVLRAAPSIRTQLLS